MIKDYTARLQIQNATKCVVVGLNGTRVPSVEMNPMAAVSDYPICLVSEWVYKKARLLEYEPGKCFIARFLHGDQCFPCGCSFKLHESQSCTWEFQVGVPDTGGSEEHGGVVGTGL